MKTLRMILAIPFSLLVYASMAALLISSWIALKIEGDQ